MSQCLSVAVVAGLLNGVAACPSAALCKKTPVDPPAALLPVPSQQQLDWQRNELIMFLHFGMNTFTDREWGEGTEDPKNFNPAGLDARQWVTVAREAGFRMMILTAKHHDGFCLWPSRYTEHSVKNSPWREGTGDVVREFAAACQEQGMKLGFYLSPWDRHETTYGDSPVYNQHFRDQLTELMTQYGPVSEVWFDGACGEGPNGKRQEYDWESFYQVVRKTQKDAVIAICGPDVRWVGNESGVARETEWSVQPVNESLEPPAEGGRWHPAECDVSIRPGWFWHAKEDAQVKPLDHLMDIYFNSVGRNSLLLLNVPPNDKGLIADADVRRLREFRQALDQLSQVDLAQGATLKASGVRGRDDRFGPEQVLDRDPETYWAPEEAENGGWIELRLKEPIRFNTVRMEEPIVLGQRVKSYRIEMRAGRTWRTVAKGTTIGYRKLDRFSPVETARVRLVIEGARACPLISCFGLYLDPRAR